MRTARLHRTWYPTDATDDEPEYVGAFSAPFPHPDNEFGPGRIVNEDWSERGVVEVTWLTEATGQP